MAASAAASVVCLTDKILWSVLAAAFEGVAAADLDADLATDFDADLAAVAALTGAADLAGAAAFLATIFGSDFLDVTEAFFTGAFGVTAGLADALLTDFAAVLLAATVAFEGFFCAGLAMGLPAFETTLLVALFAVFLTAATLGLEAALVAGLAAVFAVTFLVVVLATAFRAGFAGAFAFFAEAREDARLPVLALVAGALTGFFVVAMGSSTRWNCRSCKGNWSSGRAFMQAIVQSGHSPGSSAQSGALDPANSTQLRTYLVRPLAALAATCRPSDLSALLPPCHRPNEIGSKTAKLLLREPVSISRQHAPLPGHPVLRAGKSARRPIETGSKTLIQKSF
mgnify:CR=1 FL=1